MASVAASIRRSATSIARNETALIRKHGSTPTVAISTPAMAGPTIRAQCTITLFRLTALTTRSGPTISITKLCRAGLSSAFTLPRTSTRANTIQGATTPLTVTANSASAGTTMPSWVIISSLRLSKRSASSPP